MITMIKIDDCYVNMVFDSGIFKGQILVHHPELEYPHTNLTKEKVRIINASIAAVINAVMKTTEKPVANNNRRITMNKKPEDG